MEDGENIQTPALPRITSTFSLPDPVVTGLGVQLPVLYASTIPRQEIAIVFFKPCARIPKAPGGWVVA